jgi:LmbE family N-acetylglucosaminyl deacetylase
VTSGLPPELLAAPRILGPDDIAEGRGRTLLLIVAHADDPAFFIGGVLPLWAGSGWRIVCLRFTDDSKDSVGLSETDTVARNTAEFHGAAALLGISQIDELGWPTDCLGDASRVELRERMIHAIRRHRPYGVVTFDPDSILHEDNLDHRVLAQAVDEAFWCAQFDKHHPEHFAEGLAVHGVYERWYFGRSVARVSHVFDTSETIDIQLSALLEHRTMLDNIARQIELQAATGGRTLPQLAAARAGDHRPLFEALLRRGAAAKGAPYGLIAAETLRCSRLEFDLLARAAD